MARVNVEFVTATQEYIDGMKGRLRDSDERSCWSGAHITADDGLQRVFDRAVLCWVALVDGVPSVCWGVSRVTMVSVHGFVWLFSTDDIVKIGIRAVRNSKKYIDYMLAAFGFLETWVDVRNEVSLAWLKWCGFNVEKAEPIGLDGTCFHRLWLGTEGS